jgi:hypothetical protein
MFVTWPDPIFLKVTPWGISMVQILLRKIRETTSREKGENKKSLRFRTENPAFGLWKRAK